MANRIGKATVLTAIHACIKAREKHLPTVMVSRCYTFYV